MENNDNYKYSETQLALIEHIRKGRRAIKEAERLYRLLNEISILANKNKSLLGKYFNELEKIYSKKDDGEIITDGKNIYWRDRKKEML